MPDFIKCSKVLFSACSVPRHVSKTNAVSSVPSTIILAGTVHKRKFRIEVAHQKSPSTYRSSVAPFIVSSTATIKARADPKVGTPYCPKSPYLVLSSPIFTAAHKLPRRSTAITSWKAQDHIPISLLTMAKPHQPTTRKLPEVQRFPIPKPTFIDTPPIPPPFSHAHRCSKCHYYKKLTKDDESVHTCIRTCPSYQLCPTGYLKGMNTFSCIV